MNPPTVFWTWLQTTYGNDADKIDATALWDSSITLEENEQEILDSHPPRGDWTKSREMPNREQILLLEAEEATLGSKADAPFAQMLQGAKIICLLGNTGSGKTALSFRVTDALQALGRKVYVYKHPAPQLLPQGYGILYRSGDLEQLHDCVLYIDEPQLVMPLYDKRANDALLRLFSLCRQRNVTVVLSTSDTRYVTRGIESYVDVWLLKDLEPAMVKQGSMVKRIIRENVLLDVDGFSVPIDRFVYHARKHPEYGGRHAFAVPHWWTESCSTPFRGDV